MKKIYFWSILTLISLAFWPMRLLAQGDNGNATTDSCTIQVVSMADFFWGWKDGYLQILSQGELIATIEHHQTAPASHTITVPAGKIIDFDWHQSDNSYFSIYSESGNLLFASSTSTPPGVVFSLNVCHAPQNVSNLTVVPEVAGPMTATISWTNPTQTINNETLQNPVSIILFRNDDTLKVFHDLIAGASMSYVDTVLFSDEYKYSIIARSDGIDSWIESRNVGIGQVCQYKLVMQTNMSSGWRGGSLNFGIDPYAIGSPYFNQNVHSFTQYYNGNRTVFLHLPIGLINVEQKGITGSYTLYDANDSVILAGPQGLPNNFQWYNSCGLKVPDSVRNFSYTQQGDILNFVWTNPILTVDSEALSSLSRVEIIRNEQLIHTFTDVIPGEQLNYSDSVPNDGTYHYSVKCFNDAGGGISTGTRVVVGSNCILHDGSHNGYYSNASCMVSVSNDNHYSAGGKTVLTFSRNDTTKMIKISGSSSIDNHTNIEIYAGHIDNGVKLPSDTINYAFPHNCVTVVLDIPANSSPQFHYTVECVNCLYEQPDTTITIVPDSNGIIYVTQEGAGLRNGSSWANATPWLNRALATADTMIEKPVIWVAKGTYYGTPQQYNNETYAFLGRSNVNVFGGFAGNEPANYDLSLRNFEQNETKLDGLLQNTIVWVRNSEWNGFHILNGLIGCVIKEGNNFKSSILRKSRVTDCLQAGVFSRSVNSNASRIVDSCLILNNRGNGIDAERLNVSNTTIAYNEGDGLLARGAISNCIITHNKGVGYANTVGTLSSETICNCLVANNNGTGLSLRNEILLNSTVVNNGGVGVEVSFDCILGNCIIWGNRGESIVRPWNHDYEIRNCAVEGDYKHSSYPNIPLASPNDTSGFHPDFVNPTAGTGSAYSGGDWHLMPTSVCVNRGTTKYNNYPLTDLDGNTRIQQGIPDIGAYESPYDHPYEDGKIIYTKADSDGDGSSWANATDDLDNAIETAWIYGPETRIWVAQGTYPTPGRPYYLKENLHLLGGFVGNEPSDYDVDLRNTVEHATILDGQHQNRVLHQTHDFDDAALVDGFTLTHGQADEGAGAYLMSNSTLSKCRVVSNTVTGENAAAVTALRDTLKQLIVENNDGAGVQTESSQLLHCTVVRNNGDGIQVSGNTTQDSSLLYNSIAWGNALLNLHFTSAMAKHNTPVLFCAIENLIIDGEDNILLSSDNGSETGPHFINPTDSVGVIANLGDWQIDSSSVCVNAGTELSDLYGIHTDLAGQPRMQNGKTDIGALESPYNSEVLYRNIEAFIYEGESYLFYGNTLTTTGWYEHRWSVGEADSLVVLHLITKQVVYVSVTGAGNMDGSSWANALDGQTATANGSTKLADALQVATAGTEFWIQSGTYYACSDSDVNKSLILNDGIALYGGFAGTETTISQRDTNNSPTVFSGNLQNDSIVENNSRNIFKTNEQNIPDKILLDNIFIISGYNNLHEGSALQINESSFVQANHCLIHHHFGGAVVNKGMFMGNYCAVDSNESYCDYWDSNPGAAALINKASGVTILNKCSISHNQSPWDGAVFNIGCMAIDSSFVRYNKATSKDIGAIQNMHLLTITNSLLSNNWSFQGISTISSNGFLKLYNCLVDSNQSLRVNPEVNFPALQFPAYGSGIASHILVEGKAEIESCLFRGNSQNNEAGGGCVHVRGTASIKKSEFLGNLGAGVFQPGQGGTMSVVYNHSNVDGCVYVSSGNVLVEDCLFDSEFGGGGTSACVESGKLTMNRCVFTRNQRLRGIGQEGILAIQSGELHVQNSLFANNQNAVFNTTIPASESHTTFSNCTFVNNQETFCIFNQPVTYYEMGQYYAIPDTSYVHFNNSIIVGNWGHNIRGINAGGTIFSPNYSLQFTNTLFYHPDSTQASDCTPDSLGNIYYCDPMFVNPTTVMGVDSAQNPLLYDFRLQDGSPAINSGDTTGLHLTANATDLDGEQRVKRCQIDRGCYEYGTIVYDTVRETLCVEQDDLNQLSYIGLGFSIEQLEVGENTFTRTCDCHPDANDSVQTLLLTVSLIQHSEFEAVACDSMVWNGITYIQSGTYTQTLSDRAGCDSVVTLHLTVNHSVATDDYLTLCENELPYTYGDTVFEVGTPEFSIFHFQFSTTKGCDSVVTLHLTVHEAVETDIYEYLCNGSTYSFFGQELIFPGTYTHVGQTAHGCDSTVTLHLELKQTYSSFLNVNLCNGDGYDFFGETLYDAGTYTQTVPTEFGCDSTIVLTITTGTTTYGDLNASICDGSSYYFYGQQLTEAGDYTVTLTNSHGCDSIVTLHLTINSAYHTDQHVSACDTYVWNGQTYSASGDYDKTFTAANGCDSVVTLHLTINPSVATDEYLTISQDELPYTYGDTVFEVGTPESFIFHFQFSTADGCDSTVTLHLTITVGIDDYNLGAAMTVYPNPTTGMVNVQCTMNNVQVEAVKFQLFDAFGRLLQTTDGVETLRATSLQTDMHDSSVQTQIDLSEFAAGVYFIKAVADGNVVAVRKVIKN